jgi:hypothetical protein
MEITKCGQNNVLYTWLQLEIEKFTEPGLTVSVLSFIQLGMRVHIGYL